MGHLPHITELFLEGGTKLEHSFTVFPSDTITANGSLWTGTFSDRHGMKAQIGFNRRLGHSENYLGKLGPVLSDKLLMPQGIDRALLKTGVAATRLLRGSQAAKRFHDRRTSETQALHHYLAANKRSFGSGALPIMNDVSPPFWTRYLADEAPYLGTQRAERVIDETNTAYALEYLFSQANAVNVVWLPETDTASHHEYRGQFGMARRTIAEVDQLVGRMVNRLRRQNRFTKRI